MISPKAEAERNLDAGQRMACQAEIIADSGFIRGYSPFFRINRIEEFGNKAPGVLSDINPPVHLSGGQVFQDSVVIDHFRGGIFGAALDIGTSTVVLRLLDLATGETVFSDSFANPQIFAGGDVMSRISYAARADGNRLQMVLVRELNRIISGSGIPSELIYELVVAANPTMRDMFMGFDVSGLGSKPFYSRLESEKRAGKRASTSASIAPSSIGIKMNPKGRIFGLPLPGCHVGGDISAGILASGLARDERNSVFLDLGTNSEIVVKSGTGIVTASCPAGPAFEGGQIKCGMPGVPGAIESVKIYKDNTILLRVIEDRPPAGFCGSGLISLLGEMFASGLINSRGRLAAGEPGSTADLPVPDRAENRIEEPPPASGRLLRGISFESPAGKPRRMKISGAEGLYIDENDLSLLLQAKGAITAGLRIALRNCGLDFRGIEVFYLAGAFGKYLDLDSAMETGILPDLPIEVFSCLGNSSIEGAEIALLSSGARLDIEKTVDSMVHLELETEPDFFDLYTDGCLLGKIS